MYLNEFEYEMYGCLYEYVSGSLKICIGCIYMEDVYGNKYESISICMYI
jgi:hypothetical protein